MGQNQDMAQKFSELEAALERINAGQLAALYISIIDSQAERADLEDYKPQTDNDPYGPHSRRSERIPAQPPPQQAHI